MSKRLTTLFGALILLAFAMFFLFVGFGALPMHVEEHARWMLIVLGAGFIVAGVTLAIVYIHLLAQSQVRPARPPKLSIVR